MRPTRGIMIIAITGNIGSGKSIAASEFERHGFMVISADGVGHELYLEKKARGDIVRRFGREILVDGVIDRRKLKNIVFRDPKRLAELNAYMHPLIRERIERMIKGKQGNIAIEAALAIEAGWRFYDKLLLITVDRKVQRQRLRSKGKYTEEEMENIIKSQMAQEQKEAYADHSIDNSTTKEEFIRKVRTYIGELA